MTITVPRASTASSARSPRYVSPASQSAEVDVVYGSTTVVGATGDLVAGNSSCVTTSAGLQCTLSILVQPTATSFIVKLFDQLGEQGNVLSTATVAVPPSPTGVPVDVPVTLAGVATQIGLALTGAAFNTGVAGTRTLVVTAMDAGGNAIPGTFNQPIALKSTNPAITLSASSLSSSGSVTVTYSGSGDATLGIAATDPDGGTKTLVLAPGTTGPTPAPSPTPTPAGPLTVAPTSLAFSFIGQTQTVAVSDPNYTGAYTIAGCAGIATAGTVTNGSFTVTATGAGSCTLTVSDTSSNQATIAVGVSAVSVPIN